MFFVTAAHQQLLDLVRHLLENTEDIALLTGPRGVGKSTLVYCIQSQAPGHWIPCRVDANPMLHPDQLFNMLTRCIGGQAFSADAAESLGEALANLRLQGRLPVIIVDDAQQLPISSLMALLRLHEFKADMEPAFGLVLLAEPTINETLSTHQLHAMGTARIHHLEIAALPIEHIDDYVKHFLRMENINADLKLSAERLSAIHREGAGLPGRLNEYIVRALRDPHIDRKKTSLLKKLGATAARLPPATSVAALLLGAAVFLTLLFQDRINRLFQPTSSTTPPNASRPEPTLQPGIVRLDNGAVLQPLRLPAPKQPDAPDDDAETPRQSTPTSSLSAAQDERTARAGAEPPVTAPTPQTLPARSDMTTPQPPASDSQIEPPTSRRTAIASANAFIGATPSVERNKPAEPAEPAEPVEPAKPDEPEPSATPAPQPKPQPSVSKPSTAVDHGLKKEAWLLKQNPAHYSLQILALSNEKALPGFVKKHKLTKKAFYYQSTRKGSPWFSLLYGIYPNRDAAVTAINKLPAKLKKSGAWPRKLATIQQEIRTSAR